MKKTKFTVKALAVAITVVLSSPIGLVMADATVQLSGGDKFVVKKANGNVVFRARNNGNVAVKDLHGTSGASDSDAEHVCVNSSGRLTTCVPGGAATVGLERQTGTFSSAGDPDNRLVKTVNCSAGKVPVGGGYDINPNAVDGQVIVMESGPYGGGPGVGWRVRADGRNASVDWELVINVFCIDAPP